MNNRLIEICRFYQNSGSTIRNFRIPTSHNTSNSNGSLFVGNNEYIWVEFTLDPIQSSYSLAIFCSTYNNLFPTYLIIIKGMKWLPILQHHIVCNINNIVNRSHPTS